MKAILKDHVIAESDDIVETGGYHYFPPSAVRTEWLEKAEKTAKDLECPHGVQFYDVRPLRLLGRRRGALSSTRFRIPALCGTPCPRVGNGAVLGRAGYPRKVGFQISIPPFFAMVGPQVV